MDALTAGTALAVIQACMALTTVGLYFSAPQERCTSWWAVGSLLFAAGVLIVVWNAGAPRHVALLVGNSFLVYGCVMHWLGLQHFFKKRRSVAGWYIAPVFTLLFELLLQTQAGVTQRTLFVCSFLILCIALWVKELWPRSSAQRSIGRTIAMLGVVLILGTFAIRAGSLLAHMSTFLPHSNLPISVMVTFIVPMAGSMLFSSGLFLLYFERIVDDKNHLATHDELTGISNRRAVVMAGERELDMARRFRRPITVAMVDIDFFKDINDRHGHAAGDEVLVALAQLLGESCRAVDLVGRYGGEEFVIVLPGVDWDSAEVVGSKLLEVIAHHRFQHCESLTVSIGLAVLPATDPHEVSWRTMVNRADMALYAAKAAGRNCIRIDLPVGSPSSIMQESPTMAAWRHTPANSRIVPDHARTR
jgi:diguanylate cyclase (GGDEF)-like protein